MSYNRKRVRVLFSFPNRMGADRICYIAWQQVNGLAEQELTYWFTPARFPVPFPTECGSDRLWREEISASLTG